jgi:hypothetical protein
VIVERTSWANPLKDPMLMRSWQAALSRPTKGLGGLSFLGQLP